jgi:hypothetical protein
MKKITWKKTLSVNNTKMMVMNDDVFRASVPTGF